MQYSCIYQSLSIKDLLKSSQSFFCFDRMILTMKYISNYNLGKIKRSFSHYQIAFKFKGKMKLRSMWTHFTEFKEQTHLHKNPFLQWFLYQKWQALDYKQQNNIQFCKNYKTVIILENEIVIQSFRHLISTYIHQHIFKIHQIIVQI